MRVLFFQMFEGLYVMKMQEEEAACARLSCINYRSSQVQNLKLTYGKPA